GPPGLGFAVVTGVVVRVVGGVAGGVVVVVCSGLIFTVGGTGAGTSPPNAGSVGAPRWRPPSSTAEPGRLQTGPGGGSGATGWPASCASMNVLQILAGTRPPKPASLMFASRLPYQTDATSWPGVPP